MSKCCISSRESLPSTKFCWNGYNCPPSSDVMTANLKGKRTRTLGKADRKSDGSMLLQGVNNPCPLGEDDTSFRRFRNVAKGTGQYELFLHTFGAPRTVSKIAKYSGADPYNERNKENVDTILFTRQPFRQAAIRAKSTHRWKA